MKQLFGNKFMATNNTEDITGHDFRLLGLHKKEYFDEYGDLIKIEYYTSYDLDTDLFSNLAIVENRTYTRDPQTGLLIQRTNEIDWYDVDGNVIQTKTNLTKFYSAQKGFVANKRARQNLIDKASLYLFSALIGNAGTSGESPVDQVDNYSELTNEAERNYIKGTIQPLIDIITNSTDNTKPEYRSYVTPTIQATLLYLLNINFKPGI